MNRGSKSALADNPEATPTGEQKMPTEDKSEELRKLEQSLGVTTEDFDYLRTKGFDYQDNNISPNVSSEVFQEVQRWMMNPIHRALWISGPPNVSQPSKLTSISEYVFSEYDRSRFTVIAHRCQGPGSGTDILIYIWSTR